MQEDNCLHQFFDLFLNMIEATINNQTFILLVLNSKYQNINKIIEEIKMIY